MSHYFELLNERQERLELTANCDSPSAAVCPPVKASPSPWCSTSEKKISIRRPFCSIHVSGKRQQMSLTSLHTARHNHSGQEVNE